MAEVYKLKHLTGRRLKVFLAVADRVVPPDEDSPGGGTMMTAGVADWAMDRMEPGLRKQFLLLLMVVEFLGIFFGGKTFSKNSAEARDRELKFLESAPVGAFRMGFFGLKTYACMGYYTRENVWGTIDYGGPLVPDRLIETKNEW
jgi:hypothetical protein